MSEAVRLQKYISQSGVASRRSAEKLITAGRVRVNGKVVTELGTKVSPGDKVDVEGHRVAPQQLVYVVLNKPKGCVSTLSDPEGRPTVMELLPRNLPAHVKPVGRLDFYTEGVLLFTNDGELQAALIAPRAEIEKTYHVKIHGKVTKEQIERLRAGVRLGSPVIRKPGQDAKPVPRKDDGRKTMPAKVDTLKFTGTHTWLVISIEEGRNRQIHRMADAVGLQVLKIQRVAFAGITYYGLKIGESRQLEQDEVHALRKLAGLSATPKE
jgi:pseudouridine synthase